MPSCYLLLITWSSSTYVIGVEASCIKDSCLKMTSFKAQVDSGTSFTFLPGHVYDAITEEVPMFCELSMTVNFLSAI